MCRTGFDLNTMNTSPFYLCAFVPTTIPTVCASLSGLGRVLVFPRVAWAQPSVATRPKLQQTGVYLLLGPCDDGEVIGSTLARAI